MEDLVEPLDLVLGLLVVGREDLTVLHELALQVVHLLRRDHRILQEARIVEIYRVGLVVWQLGCVDLDFWSSPGWWPLL